MSHVVYARLMLDPKCPIENEKGKKKKTCERNKKRTRRKKNLHIKIFPCVVIVEERKKKV